MGKDFPRRNELVIATVRRVEEHGVICTLDEYGGLEAYIPRGHVASGRIRDLRDFIREGEKVVGRVIRANRRKGQVDLSLRYVSEMEAAQKMTEWKCRNRALSLIRVALKDEGLVSDVWEKLDSYFRDPLGALEDSTISGPKVLMKAGIPKGTAEKLCEVAKAQLKRPVYVRQMTVKLLSYRSDGVEFVKRVLSSICGRHGEAEVLVRSIGSPRYLVQISSTNPRAVKRAAEIVLDKLSSSVKQGKDMFELLGTRDLRKRTD